MSATSAPREEKVAERIKLTANDGTIEPLEEKAFGREDELQALIATHPELLDGEKMRQEELDRLLQTGGEAEQQPVDRRVERRRAEKVHLRRHSRPLDLEQQRPAEEAKPRRPRALARDQRPQRLAQPGHVRWRHHRERNRRLAPEGRGGTPARERVLPGVEPPARRGEVGLDLHAHRATAAPGVPGRSA